jgi:hypothetical protein
VDRSAREPPRRISTGGLTVTRLAVSPDGHWLAFMVAANGIHVAPLDTEGPPRRVSTGAEDTAPSFASDSRKVYFETRTSGEAEIRAVPVDGGEATMVLERGARAPAESPDGAWLVYLQEVSSTEAIPMAYRRETGTRAPLSKDLAAGSYGAMRFVPGAARVAVLRGNNEILEIDLATGAIVDRFDAGGDQIGGFTYAKGELIVSLLAWEGDLWTATLGTP